MIHPSHELQPGIYGKLPSNGDFVSRRLPATFVGPWDRWLQESIADSRDQLGERWLETYLISPVWRFALAPGTRRSIALGWPAHAERGSGRTLLSTDPRLSPARRG